MPKVSVIVPVYKVEAYLSRCIDSILTQTFTDFELILVDDGSPDKSGIICDEYAARDSRISVIHKVNGGVSSARNAGLDVAQGEYIAFVDSDDTVSDLYLEELIEWSRYDYVTSGFWWQDRDGIWHKRIFDESDAVIDSVRTKPSCYLGKYYFGSPWATLMKRELIEKTGLRFDTTIHSGEDTLFIISYLSNITSIKVMPFCGYKYHYYPTSLVNKYHDDIWRWKIIIEQAFNLFFDTSSKYERDFMLNRQFTVLIDSIEYYYRAHSPKIIKSIFTEPFYSLCVDNKRKTGTIRERVLIFFLEKDKYTLYRKMTDLFDLICRIRRKIHRITG